jgi:hypothetical protein
MMASIDFSQFATVRELRALIKEIEGEIERRREQERERFLAELDEKATEYGVRPQYFYRRPKAKNKSRATAVKKRYQNPNNPEEIYEPGRGVKQPEWFKANSENIEAMEIGE